MKSVFAAAAVVALVAGAAQATPAVNSAKINTRLYNDTPGSTLVVTNAYPALINISDSNITTGVNRHNWRFSANGGASNALFNNADTFSFAADLTISGAGNGEASIGISPWYSQNFDGLFNVRTSDGEVACFGGRLPFYSFTAAQGVHYVKGDTVRVGIEYDAHSLSMADPATIRYTYGALTSGWIPFDEGNVSEGPLHGLWGILDAACAGGHFQGAPSLNVSWGNISFIPAPGCAALLGLGGLVATRRRR